MNCSLGEDAEGVFFGVVVEAAGFEAVAGLLVDVKQGGTELKAIGEGDGNGGDPGELAPGGAGLGAGGAADVVEGEDVVGMVIPFEALAGVEVVGESLGVDESAAVALEDHDEGVGKGERESAEGFVKGTRSALWNAVRDA
jgi:hypothetical protein